MNRNVTTIRSAGFSLAEICISLAVLAVVGSAGYSMLMSATTLLAKNVSINSSNILTRKSLDRMFSEINQGNRLPTLINADGTAATSPGPAAGILLDRYLGGPYIVGNPGTGLAATSTVFNLFYSSDPLANPPVPAKDDVVIMDGATRALVSSCTAPSSTFVLPPTPAPSPGKMVTVTLQNILGTYTVPPTTSGTAIGWGAGSQQSAYLVHRKAFVVVPVNGTTGPAELRMYSNAENVADYNDPTNYVVLTRAIGTKTVKGLVENQPFSIVTQNGIPFLSIALRVEDQQFNKRLATQQANEFNTFLRVDTLLRPRNMP
jgi:hypothetical protein